MEKLNWLQTPSNATVFNAPNTPGRLAPGRFYALVGGVDCLLDFKQSALGVLSGTFHADGEDLEIMGGVVNTDGSAYGFLLEPGSNLPVAIFQAQFDDNTLTVDIDVPDFAQMLMMCNPERLVFARQTQKAPVHEEGAA